MLCCIVFVLLKAMFMFVCLKRLVSFLTFGLWYVDVAHFCFNFLLFLCELYAVFVLLALLCVYSRSYCFVLSVVGFRYMSISRLDWFRIIKRPRKFIFLLFSYVGQNWRFGCQHPKHVELPTEI